MAFNGGGGVAATATTDGKLRLWNVATGNPLTGELPHPGIIQSMAFSADDRFVVTASVDHRVRVWNVGDGSLHAAIEVGESGMSINWIAISPTDLVGLSGCGESKARLWNLESGEVEAFVAEHAGAIPLRQFQPRRQMADYGWRRRPGQGLGSAGRADYVASARTRSG